MKLPDGAIAVPALEFAPGAEQAALVTLRHPGGEQTLAGFTSLAALVDAFGPDQAWVAVSAEDWAEMERQAPGPLLLDPTANDIIDWAGTRSPAPDGTDPEG